MYSFSESIFPRFWAASILFAENIFKFTQCGRGPSRVSTHHLWVNNCFFKYHLFITHCQLSKFKQNDSKVVALVVNTHFLFSKFHPPLPLWFFVDPKKSIWCWVSFFAFIRAFIELFVAIEIYLVKLFESKFLPSNRYNLQTRKLCDEHPHGDSVPQEQGHMAIAWTKTCSDPRVLGGTNWRSANLDLELWIMNL